ITASAAASPAPPQPSDLAASAARRPISAVFSRASASKAPLFALRHGGHIRAGHRPDLADLLVHLRDLLADRRELAMPGHLAAHLVHLRYCQLPADRLSPPRRPRPQEPRPVPRMIRGSTRAVRLPAPA